MDHEEFFREYERVTSSDDYKLGVKNWTRDLAIIAFVLWIAVNAIVRLF